MFRSVNSLSSHARGLTQLCHDDVWLASYPRSGNTRLRMLLGQAHLLAAGSCQRCVPKNVEQLMPVWGFSDLSKFDQRPRFVKTHRVYIPAMRRPDRRVLLIRDPHQAIASAARMHRSQAGDQAMTVAAYVAHWRLGIDGWIRTLRSWLRVADVVIQYEDLMRDAAGTVIRMCRELGVDFKDDLIVEAAALTSLERARESEQRDGIRDQRRFDGNFQAVGPGDDTLSQTVLSEADRDHIETQLQRYNIDWRSF
jgi:hypothetical protein